MSARRSLYVNIIAAQAREQGMPAALVDAVAFVESGYEPGAIGRAGEIGIMQVLPSTAVMLGFHGTAGELAAPEINMRYGIQYLAGALRAAGGDLCRALMKYRAGHGEETLSPRSSEYCRKAREHLAALGSPLAASISTPIAAISNPVPPGGTMPKMRALTPAERSRQFWAAHDARVKAITAAVHAKWARLAQHRGG
jgi:soluble lytic murein transglycosylase-like protein